jgi:signal transduction histidine kinase
VITRLTATYLAIFACVLAVLSFVAYLFVSQQYQSLLLPALATPEGQAAYAAAMRRVGLVIVAFDIPLLILVGIVSALLARVSIAPMLQARERERQFVADAAHSLRSPLATIATVAQATANDTPTSRTREALDLIALTALDASGLIADLLTLARDPAPHLLQREPVDLGALAKRSASEYAASARERAIALSVETTPAIVDGDERRLRELIRNLLDNGLRHARSNVLLSVRNDGNYALLRVSDDGPGIPENERAHVFERFSHGSTHASGSGLGLSISKWIAEAHSGSLALNDEPKWGATLVARIPSVPIDSM